MLSFCTPSVTISKKQISRDLRNLSGPRKITKFHFIVKRIILEVKSGSKRRWASAHFFSRFLHPKQKIEKENVKPDFKSSWAAMSSSAWPRKKPDPAWRDPAALWVPISPFHLGGCWRAPGQLWEGAEGMQIWKWDFWTSPGQSPHKMTAMGWVRTTLYRQHTPSRTSELMAHKRWGFFKYPCRRELWLQCHKPQECKCLLCSLPALFALLCFQKSPVLIFSLFPGNKGGLTAPCVVLAQPHGANQGTGLKPCSGLPKPGLKSSVWRTSPNQPGISHRHTWNTQNVLETINPFIAFPAFQSSPGKCVSTVLSAHCLWPNLLSFHQNVSLLAFPTKLKLGWVLFGSFKDAPCVLPTPRASFWDRKLQSPTSPDSVNSHLHTWGHLVLMFMESRSWNWEHRTPQCPLLCSKSLHKVTHTSSLTVKKKSLTRASRNKAACRGGGKKVEYYNWLFSAKKREENYHRWWWQMWQPRKLGKIWIIFDLLIWILPWWGSNLF